MSHKIDSEFTKDWPDEITQCHNCSNFDDQSDQGFCSQARMEVPFAAHCNLFQGKD